MGEGPLVQDIDTDPDTTDVDEISVMGQLQSTASEEESRKVLRDQLRKTLNHRQELSGM